VPLKVVRALENDADILSVSADTPVVSSMSLDPAMLNQIGGDASPLTATTTTSTTSSTSTTSTSFTETSRGTTTKTVQTSLLQATLGLTATRVEGSNITVAVIDSGIAPVADLRTRIVASYDFTAGGASVKPSDAYGHGTHVAGLVGGSGSTSYGLYPGVAPAVKFVSLKVLDATGSGSPANVIKAIQFAVAQKAKLNIKIINLSLGHPIFEPAATDPLVQAVEAAVRAGIVVVAASGNFGINSTTGLPGYAGVTSPGNAPSAITVGSQQLNGTPQIADDIVPIYSSRGPTWYDGFVKPEVVAPGHRQVAPTSPNSTLYKLFATLYPSFLLNNGQYLVLSGTSMATGVASGVAAQVIYAPPGLTPAAVKAVMQYTASTLKAANGETYDTLTQGTGALNGAGAIALASAINPSMPVGSYWLTYGVSPYSRIAGEVRAWSENVVWGTSTLGGDTVTANQFAWADNVVWGTSTVLRR
jgi:serine protease AprX